MIGLLKDVWGDLMPASQKIPQADHVALRPTKKDVFDLTSARVFLGDKQYRQRVVDLLKEYYPNRKAPNGAIKVYTVVPSMLLALTHLHTLWGQNVYLTDVEGQEAERWAKDLGQCWKLMAWKAGLCGRTAQCTSLVRCRPRGGTRPINCIFKIVFVRGGDESMCLLERHVSFAQHVWIGCLAKTCWEPIRDRERAKEEHE